MARFKVKGDIECINPIQLDYISSILEAKGFKEPDLFIEAVGSAGDNYVANVKRIIVNENGVTFKMIAKLAPDNPIMREMANTEMLFQNENVIYSELLPKFRQLQLEADTPINELFKSAEFYGSYMQVPNEVILLEDLKDSDYVLMDRFKPLTIDCVKMVLKNLAVYHSLSYALKYREPATFDILKSKLQNALTGPMAARSDIKLFFEQMERDTLNIVQDEKYKTLLKGSISDIFSHALKVTKADTDSKHAIIQQGDGWTNNILFKMEGANPLGCVLIDYQLARESNPAFDIMYMLFNSTSHKQRQKHYYEFLDYYHNELDKSLYKFGLKASFVFPRDQLDVDLKRYARYMLATSVIVSSFLTKKTEDAEKFKEIMKENDIVDAEAIEIALTQDQETSILYKIKIEGLIDSFLEFGLLQII